MKRALLAGAMLAALVLPANAPAAVSLQPVGNFASPIYLTAPQGDPRLFVVERGGTIKVLHDGVTSQFLDIHTLVDSDPTTERGLLSMAFDPNFASNGLFYVFFTDNGTAGAAAGDNHVDEFRVSSNPNFASAGSRRPVLTIVRNTSAGNHNGGQLQFGKDGLLYVSTGDAANSANAQDPSNLNGKLLRINPHVGGGGPEVWSSGLRNPFRFSFDRLTGDIVIGDVGSSGPSVAEEVEFAPQSAGLGHGANYGWPCREGFAAGPSPCSGAFTDPVFAYPHSGGGCAVIGGFVYRGTRVPELAGRYLYTDLCEGDLRSLKLGLPLASDDRSEGVPAIGNPNSFGEDGNCELYVISGGGSVEKIVSGSPPAAAAACPVGKTKKCKRKKKKKHHKHHAAAAKKKHSKHKKKKCKRKKHKKKHKR
jgi:glucose/arabinose dehydrogenase